MKNNIEELRDGAVTAIGTACQYLKSEYSQLSGVVPDNVELLVGSKETEARFTFGRMVKAWSVHIEYTLGVVYIGGSWKLENDAAETVINARTAVLEFDSVRTGLLEWVGQYADGVADVDIEVLNYTQEGHDDN